jgi:hypothetical protein
MMQIETDESSPAREEELVLAFEERSKNFRLERG